MSWLIIWMSSLDKTYVSTEQPGHKTCFHNMLAHNSKSISQILTKLVTNMQPYARPMTHFALVCTKY